MEFNRAKVVDEAFLEFLDEEERAEVAGGGPARAPAPDAPYRQASTLTCGDLLELFDSMIVSRHLDLEARAMRARDEGFYTIGSSGHEGNAVVGRLTRADDPAYLHYRSGAFMAERARKDPSFDIVRVTALGMAASREDPVAGGRHKVWGSSSLWVPPQTSTIGSHLPKSVGAAFALERAKKVEATPPVSEDAIVVCSFGDATVNHATAQTALNASAWAAYQKIPLPILFVCEDNGIGVSVHTPTGWIETSLSRRPHIRYFKTEGRDPVAAWDTAQVAVDLCRRYRTPVFLHLEMVRLLGHAGSDPEWEYHTEEQIEEAESRDPLRATARRILDRGILTAAGIRERYEDVRERVRREAEAAARTPKLSSPEEVMAPLVEDPCSSEGEAVLERAREVPEHDERVRVFGGEERLPERGPKRHMAMLLNHGLRDLLLQYPGSLLFGEDVARKGGVYHVTAGLTKAFGVGRVFNTLLDETTILGMAIGAAHMGLLPLPEIQYLAYVHNAEDQIRGEACSQAFFSKGRFRNGMVVRIASWAYQRGFGGHFHNDNGIGALRDVPGLVIASPSRGDDAVRMLRTSAALAAEHGRVVAFLEPIALYMKKHLYEEEDEGWLFDYPPPGEAAAFLEGRVYDEEASDLTILTWANGLWLSLRAARRLREEHGIAARVVDLRWLKPLDEELIREQARATGRVLVVDEGRRTAGVGEGILSILAQMGEPRPIVRRLSGEDSYIPLGPAARLVLPSEEAIVEETLSLLHGGGTPEG